MTERQHILICGEVGVGKSTLIQRLLAQSTRPLYGFITKKLDPDEDGFHPIYIHPAGGRERRFNEENLIGTCDRRIHNINLDVFNTLGVDYLQAKPGGIILMDELGFMEAKAEAFTRAVMEALNGDIPVIAAVKARFDIPFLNEVRAHKKAKLYMIMPQNREQLFEELDPLVQTWIRQ
ncbi:MAG: nucleoside-triphosphatase [Christensenella sp.]|nr:nucleoside-triphosphatase [Christensenella sp.]